MPNTTTTHIPIIRHPANATQNDYILMTLPLLAMSCYLYGFRPALLCLFAAVVAMLCDRAVAAMRRLPYDRTDTSSIAFALIVTLLLPANTSYNVVLLAVCTTVLLGKAAFGGYGAYVFSPPAVGFTVVAISRPEEIFSYPSTMTRLPLFSLESIPLTEGPLVVLKAGGLPNIDILNLVLGNYPASMGAAYALIILACFAFLWMRKRITLSTPIGFLVTCVLIAYLFPRLGGIGLTFPWEHVSMRLTTTLYELLSGAILFAAVFLINDDVTQPKRQDARILYGIILGIFTMIFRYYGSYNIGICFAIICTNVMAAPLDRLMSSVKGGYKKRLVANSSAQPSSTVNTIGNKSDVTGDLTAAANDTQKGAD